jgi:hypothetical protein
MNARRTAIEKMYQSPLPMGRTGPLYNAFSYPTKISPEAIALFIATHTEPGDTIADVFSGSGTTGIASLLCERPTPYMIEGATRLGIEPRWGPRTTHLFDVGVLGTFISRTLTDPPCPREFEAAVSELGRAAQEIIGPCYAAENNGQEGAIRHVVWSEVIKCPQCATDHTLWSVAARKNPARLAKSFCCDGCGREQSIDQCLRVEADTVDVYGCAIRTRLRVPVEIHGKTGQKKWVRPPTEADLEIAELARCMSLPASAPNAPIRWGELHRSGYHSGITHLHHLYTPRNFLAVATLMDLADRWQDPIRSALKFCILSYNASHSTLMTRIVAKKNQRDFSVTGAQSGVLYVSGMPVEKNVIAGIARKASTIRDALSLIHGATGKVHVHNVSSERLPLESESVDYIFTDPPFGDYIPYAEVNQVNELWLGKLTDRTLEAVVSKSGGKDELSYQESMSAIFSEANRVLKPNGLVTVVFHSAHSRIWRALTASFASAKLRVRATSILDKIQESFKQVVSIVSVKGDPLILLAKDAAAPNENDHAAILQDLAREVKISQHVDVRSLYSRYVSTCLAHELPVQLDAAEFARTMRLDDEVAA